MPTTTIGFGHTGPRIHLLATTHLVENERYFLRIESAQKLIKPERMSGSDPYVKIFFNGLLVGQTAHASDATNPVWQPVDGVTGKPLLEGGDGERIDFTVPIDTTLPKCKLEIEVHSYMSATKTAFIGCVALTGIALVTFLKGNNSQSFPLVQSSKAVYANNKLVPKGEIKIKACPWSDDDANVVYGSVRDYCLLPSGKLNVLEYTQNKQSMVAALSLKGMTVASGSWRGGEVILKIMKIVIVL